MPRRARLDAAGTLHHVIIRGIEGRDIFLHNRDRDDFVDRCSRLFPESMTVCYAWAVLSNHVHLLLRTGTVSLSVVMARLLTGYAVSFNKRHRRHGHLFQNRYKSIICQEDVYLKELVRYIHLNPLRAGIVADLDALLRYPYCGHGALMGRRKQPWQDAPYILACFGPTKPRARYLDFLRAGMKQKRRPDLVGGGLVRSHGGWIEARKTLISGRERLKGDERILGDTTFVMRVLAHAKENLERTYALKQAGIDLATIEQKVITLCGVSREDLYSKGRQKRLAEARSLLCFFAVRELGVPATAMADRLGMSQPGVGYAVTRGQKIAREKGQSLFGG